MKIIIDIDEDQWMEAWMDWSDALPSGKAWPAPTGNLKSFAKVVERRTIAALAIATERVRFIEDEMVEDDLDEDT